MYRLLLCGVVMLGLLVGGFYALNAYMYNAKQAEDAPLEIKRDKVLAGVVSNVDSSAAAFDGPILITFNTTTGDNAVAAVPSMGLQQCDAVDQMADPYTISVNDQIVVRGETDIDGQILPCISKMHYLQISREVVFDSMGIGVSYRVGPDGYIETALNANDQLAFVAGISLMRQSEVVEPFSADVSRELPPTHSVQIFANPDQQSLAAWVEGNPETSRLAQAPRSPVAAEVAGLPALRYQVDGLYMAEVYAVAHEDHVVILTGEYLDSDSSDLSDFEALVSSVRFVRR